MAVTARFQADFSSFYDAVSKADVKLADFTRGAGRVESALNRMTDSFSGRKVIQEAALMERAIGGVEGLSKLTEAELRKVGNTAAEAVEKMKRMGIEVPPGLQKIANAAQPIPSMFSKIMGALGPLGPMVAGAFSIGAVVGFGREILGNADALVKLRDKTGISLSGLQDLQAVARESGNSIEQLTGAVSMMQNRLASGDDSAIAAIKTLGLSFVALQQQQPDEQLRSIARAIGEIEDPAKRTQLAMDAFGRSGAEILPTLLADMDAIAAGAVKMSDEQIEAMERVGDALGRWYDNTLARTAMVLVTMYDFAAKIGKLSFVPKDQNPTGQPTAPASPQLDFFRAPLPTLDVQELDRAFTKLNGTLEQHAAVSRKAGQEAERAAAANLRWHDSVKSLTSASVGAERSFGAIGRLMPALVGNTGDWQGQLSLLGSTDLPLVVKKLQDMGQSSSILEKLPSETDAWRASLSALDSVLTGINSDFAQMGTVAVRTFKEIEALIKSSATLGQKFSGAATIGLGGAAAIAGDTPTGGVLAGAAAGAAMGSMFGPWGTAIGAGVGALAAWVKGARAAIRETDKLRDQFILSAKGLHELNDRAQKAGVTLNAMLDARNPKAYEAALKDLNEALEFQDEAMRFLDETVQKYGFSLSELGGKFGAKKMAEEAFLLIKEFRGLEAAGISVENISAKMSDGINAYLQAALKTGVAVPESMREILNQLATMGLLTDASGNKIEDLEKSGVTFAKTLDEQFEGLIGTIERLVQAIERGLGGALRNIPALPSGGSGGIGSGGGAGSDVVTGQSRGGGTLILEIGGRRLAEIIVPEIPGVVRRYGLA